MKQTLFLVVTGSSVAEVYSTRKSSRKERNKLALQGKGELLETFDKAEGKMTDIQSLRKCL